jgi:EmrB/QacA subfamily drug resistance transporter
VLNTKLLTNDYTKWLAFIGIALLSFGCYLDYTVVNIALPTIQKEMQTSLISLQWVMNIYFLALCVFSTIMGRCGDLYGRRRCFYIGAAVFGISSILAGFSPNIYCLIAGRLLQGIGAAMVFALGFSLLPASFPEKEQSKAIGWLGSVGGIALALGPILGGVIVTQWGWRWIFFINVPIILVGYLFCITSVKESAVTQQQRHFDIKGMLLLAFAMVGIVLSLIHSQHFGWVHPMTIGALAIGILAIFLLIKVEKSQKDPLINFKDFSKLLFYSGAILCFLAGAFSAVTLFFDPLYLQIIKGQSPQTSGFILFAIPIAVFLIAFFIGWIVSWLGVVNTILLGLLLAVLAAFLQTFFTSTTSLSYVIFAFFCLGAVWAMGNTVSIIAGQTAVEPERKSVATGVIIMMFNVGGSIGLALSVVVYHTVTSRALSLIQTGLNAEQFSLLDKLILSPSAALRTSMDSEMYSFFHAIFMLGFTRTMWFLAILAAMALFSVLIWKMLSGNR